MSSDLSAPPRALDDSLPVTVASSQLADAPLQEPQQSLAPALPDARARTRISGIWVGIVIAAGLLVLLLVFILQNTAPVKVSFFTAQGSVPLGVLLLFAAIGGVLVAAVSASLRILQIRHRLRGSSEPTAISGPAAATEHASDRGEDRPVPDHADMNGAPESPA